jgi:excisionase family DNA binding protein
MEQLYTVEQAAEKLQVQPRTVRDWLKAGKLGGLITGRFWRIRESDLQTFLQKAEIFARLKYFRSQNPGWGYPEIAQQLNREGLLPPSGDKEWRAETLSNFLSEEWAGGPAFDYPQK